MFWIECFTLQCLGCPEAQPLFIDECISSQDAVKIEVQRTSDSQSRLRIC